MEFRLQAVRAAGTPGRANAELLSVYIITLPRRAKALGFTTAELCKGVDA